MLNDWLAGLGETSRHVDDPPAGRAAALLALILVLAAAIRLLTFNGYFGSDDGDYAFISHAIANDRFSFGSFAGPSVFPLRVGLLYPTALAFKVFGTGEFAMLIYPFTLSLASVLLAFLSGTVFFGTTAGLVAAALLSVLPIESWSATMLLPDLPAAFWSGSGILALFWGSRRESAASAAGLGALSGLFLGISWLCKASVIYLAPIILIYLFSIRRRQHFLPLAASFTAAALFIPAAEALAYRNLTGDFFHRLTETERNFREASGFFFREGSPYGYGPGDYWKAVGGRLFLLGPKTILLNPHFGLVTLTALGAAVLALGRKGRGFLFPSFWFLSLLLMFNFSSARFTAYEPLVLFHRYLYPMLLPAVILNAGVLSLLLRSRRPYYFLAILLSMLLALPCLAGVAVLKVKRGIRSPVERELARTLSPRDRIFTDSRTLEAMQFFWAYPEEHRMLDFEGMGTGDIPPDSYILFNPDREKFLERIHGYRSPSVSGLVPAGWELRWEGHNASLHHSAIEEEKGIEGR